MLKEENDDDDDDDALTAPGKVEPSTPLESQKSAHWESMEILWNHYGLSIRWPSLDNELIHLMSKAMHQKITLEQQKLPLKAKAPMWGVLGHLYGERFPADGS